MRNRSEIEGRVADLIARHRIIAPAVPVDAVAIAEGLQIIEQPFPGDVSGALIYMGGTAAIAINGSQHANRKRFSIAHELAHYLLKHRPDGEDHIDWKFSILRRDGKSSEASDTNEIEANMFAANLLMPRQFVQADLNAQAGLNGEVEISSDLVRTLAGKYRVSEAAMNFRLINLGFLPPA